MGSPHPLCASQVRHLIRSGVLLGPNRQQHLPNPLRGGTRRKAFELAGGNTMSQPPFGGAGENFPRRLREAEVPLVSDAEAREAYGRVYNPPTMVAAGQKSQDTPHGDSGGPMFPRVSAQQPPIRSSHFGYGCGTKRLPSA